MKILDDIKKLMLMFLRSFFVLFFVIFLIFERYTLKYLQMRYVIWNLLQNNLGNGGMGGSINKTNLIIILLR